MRMWIIVTQHGDHESELGSGMRMWIIVTEHAVCEVFRKKKMITYYHDNMITLS
jgi:hypothetical protein